MRDILVFIFVFLISNTLFANINECHKHLNYKNYVFYDQIQKHIDYLSPEDNLVLQTLVYLHLGYNSLEEFVTHGFLDFQFYSMPNYNPKHRSNDLHYKLMMHYKHSSQTIIYNSVTQQIVERRTREDF